MSVTVSPFGRYLDGREVQLYTISNGKGVQAAVTNVGAVLVKLICPDREGRMADIVLGFDRGEAYLNNPSFFGAVIGPNANRIGGATFQLDGVTYQLDVNNGVNNLHSHKEQGWHKRLWNAAIKDNSVIFSLEDEDGGMGFPGNKKVSVTYSLNEQNELRLHYHGSSDRRTILNLTNHSYFNLEGHDQGRIGEHVLQMEASCFTPADGGSIPTGDIWPVTGTPMDFTRPKQVGQEIDAEYEQLRFAGGYDHNWVIDNWDGTLRQFAVLQAPESGRIMEASTTLPGVQFYAGNFIEEQAGKGGAVYGYRSGLCLETQYFPDTANKPQFPGAVFGEGEDYDSVTVYRFGTV